MVINNFTNSGINAKQIERVCHKYGQWIEDEDNQAIEEEVHKAHEPEKANELHYVSVDGAMYLKREDSWKESKLGRIYQSKDIVQVSKTHSTHLGENKEFIPKMDYHLSDLNNLVFIAVGARWIWKWIEQSYPESIQIVDYYHAKEHLCEFT